MVKNSDRLRKLAVGVGIALCGSAIAVLYDHERFFQLGPFRVVRAGVTVLCIVTDYKWTMWTCPNTDILYHQKLSATHVRSARKLLKLAENNGGVYIKVGQHLASLEYLLPVEYTDALCVLHSKAPESKLVEVRQVLEEDLNAKVEDIFVGFNETPEGSASLAQVYRAVLRKNNEEVAVKVQHIHVKPRSWADIKTIETLTRLASRLFPDFHFMWLVDEMKRNLPMELDFRVEAANAKKLEEMFSHLDYLKIPKIYDEYTTERVLVMEYCDGAQINDYSYFIQNNINPYDVCRKLGALFSEMIFINGYVHCDPHPGNVLVSKAKDGRVSIILLDHGLYLTLGSDFRIKYSKLWLALLESNLNEVKKCAQSMGVGELYGLFACMVTNRSWDAISHGIDKSAATYEEQREIKSYAATLIPEISQVLERMPRSMLLILKTNDLLRSIEYRLGTQGRADAFVQMARCCIRSVHQHSAEQTNSLLIKICVYVLVMPPRLVRYRSVIPAVEQERIKGNYSWGTFLGGLLRTLNRSGDVRSRCPEYIVPVESFHEAPLIEYMKDIDTNVEFEVALLDDYGFKSGPVKLYWFARVVKIMGYRLLLRFEGMDEKGDNTYDFWVNISSQDLKPIGYCAEDIENRGLVPPQLIYERQPNWQQYILNQIPCYKTFSINWPEILVQKITSCKYKRGDEVELLDSIFRMRVRPAYVEQVIGGRIWVCLNSKFAIRPMIIKGDFQLCEGVWMDQNSPIIFPIGWAWRNGYRMEANGDYFNHVEEVTTALQLGSADNPIEEHEANPSMLKTEAEGDEITWKIGMKLEVLDPFGSWNELRVSTVTKIMDNGFLKINFDGEMEHHAVPLHSTSELLFPVGYGAKYGISVKKPKNLHDPGNFDWNVYLRMTNGVPAPEELFHTFRDDVLSNFKIGARLEATDMCESNLICPATISSHHGRLLKISYEGWGSNYNQLFDYRSPNIFPVGWCEMHGYKLSSPAMAKKKRRN